MAFSIKFSSIITALFIGVSCFSQIVLDSIPDGTGYTYIASPNGSGPFPAVLYNHGGLDTLVGGDLRGTVVALAEMGYIARAEKRMETFLITGHLQEVETALDELRADPRTDTSCVTIMGFSRGGYLSLEAAKQNPGKANGCISMAPANPANLLVILSNDVSPFDDPVLLMIAENDTFQDQHVLLAQMMYDSLIAGSITATLNTYPHYDSNGNTINDPSDDGHELFSVVQQPYWSDVLNFLSTNSCTTMGIAEHHKERPIVYPNPANGSIHLPIEYKDEKYEIVSTSGTVVQYGVILSNTLDISSLQPGMYVLRLNNNNTFRIIREK